MTTETLLSPAYFVSPNGRDTWSGRLAAPNADGTDGPFATLTQARDAMRVSGIATTYVRGGTYTLGSTLQLTAADSNHAFLGYPGETVVLSGGEYIAGFRDEGGGVFSALVAGGAVDLDLSIGGVRQSAAQSGVRDSADPTSGFFWADEAAGGPSRRAFTFRDGDIRPEDIQPGAKVQVFDRERLTDDILTIESVDFATHTVHLASDTWYPLRNGSTFRLLNNAAFLRNAGEFGWSADDGRLYVKPQDPAGFEQAGVVAARTGTLIDISGATGVTLQGLTFADTTWNGTAVRLTNATGVRIGNNRFLNVGTALSLTASSQNLIGGNVFEQLGSSGIALNPGSNGNRIYANRFEHIGEVAKYVAAISGAGINDTVISHNDIAWSARDGIAIKNWSAETKNVGNVVEYNRIAHTGQETADASAISVLGRSDIDTRMVIRGNRIEDANGVATSADHVWLRDYKGFGIYLDDQTNGAAVTGNFIDNADWAGVFIHGGDSNAVENNFVAMRNDRQELIRIEWVPLAGDAGTPRNNTVTRNIAYGVQPVDDYWDLLSANNPVVDGNLVFNSPGRGPADMVADPRFVDPATGDWRLGAGSPAGALGIQDLLWASMGLAGYSASAAAPAFWSAVAAPAEPVPVPPPTQPASPPPSPPGGGGGGGSGGGGGGSAPTAPIGAPAAAGGLEAAFLSVAAAHGITDPGVAAGLSAFAAGQAMNVRVAAPTGVAALAGDGSTALLLDGRGLPAGAAVQVDGVGYLSLVGAVQVTGGAGANWIVGDAAAQTVSAGPDRDSVMGGSGDDVLYGNAGADILFGNAGGDVLYGGIDADTLYGGMDADWLNGNVGDDVVNGNLGNDTVHGGQGNDAVYGGQNDDELWGDLGDDTLSGDLGNDTLWGGAGADRFVFRAGAGTDVIGDFRAWEGDCIELQGLGYSVGMAAGGDALLILDDGSRIHLAGTASGAVTMDWFILR